MKHDRQLVARVFLALLAAAPMTACVSPAARVPCDGRLEPINLPAKKAKSSARLDAGKSKVTP
jgi:hypothetical protein